MSDVWRIVVTAERDASLLLLVISLLMLACIAKSGTAAETAEKIEDHSTASQRMLPAEFETQAAVLLSWHAEDVEVQQALTELVASGWRSTRFVILVQNSECREQASELFSQAGIPRRVVRYLRATCDTIWTRDYGPLLVRSGRKKYELVDADYDRGERPNDDRVPEFIADQLSLATVHLPLTVEGGNLLSNGRGICLATTKMLQDNLDRGYTEHQIRTLLKIGFGAQQTVFLEPLAGEPTEHVDMFATFISEDTVVVGEYSPIDDPFNAAVLNRNAEMLRQVMTARGPLRVVRVPMPPRGDENLWRTYTNVLFANRNLLVPVYPEIDEDGQLAALSTYRRLLPGWRITPVNCEGLIELGGALHCVSMNLAHVNRLPAAFPLEYWPEDEPLIAPQLWLNPADEDSLADGDIADFYASRSLGKRWWETTIGDSTSEMFEEDQPSWPEWPGDPDAGSRVIGGRRHPFADPHQAPVDERRRPRKYGRVPWGLVEPPRPRE